MKYPLVDFFKKYDIPLTREKYIAWNWMGDYDPEEILPSELVSEIPPQLRLPEEKEEA